MDIYKYYVAERGYEIATVSVYQKHSIGRTPGGQSRRRFRLRNTLEDSNGRLKAMYMYYVNTL